MSVGPWRCATRAMALEESADWCVCVCRPVALCHLGHGVGGVLSGVCVCVCVGPWRHATRAMALEELCECVCVCVSVCFLIQRVRSGIR